MSTASADARLSTGRLKLGAFALAGLGFLALAAPAFAEPMTFWTGIVLGEYAYPSHELHHLVLGSVFPVLLVGVLAQAYRPRRRVGALHSVLVVWICLTAVFALGGEFSPMHVVLLGLLLAMALTHPAGSDQLPSREGLDRRMAAVAVVTALGALAFAGVELLAHFTAEDAHVGFDHYLFMATTASSIACLALYASFRGVGWRFPAYTSAFLLTVVGLGSVLYPGGEQGSSLGLFGLAVVGWALLFVAVAERGDELAGTVPSRDRS